MKYSLTFLLSLLGLISIYGQSPSTSYSLLLRSGTEVPPENISAFITSPSFSPSESIQGRIYRLVQFYEIPTLSDIRSMEKAGMIFEAYIPHNAYLMSLPTSLDWMLLNTYGARSIIKLSTRHKMSPELAMHNVPPHAAVGNLIWLQAMAAEQVPITLVQQQLSQKGASIEKVSAESKIIRFGIALSELEDIASLPGVQYLEFIPEKGEPEDREQVSLQRANVINGSYGGALKYDGTGVSVVVRDDGDVGPHIDFQGRTSQTFASAIPAETHGDRVASVVGGAGNLNPAIQGMAPGAFLHIMDYQADFLDSTLRLHTDYDVMITNSSYSNGCNDCYTLTTRTVDEQGYKYPSLLHVFSAGNSGTSNCGYGAGNVWGNVTGGHKIGKNVIATASLNVSGNLVNSSSRGPSADGRLKPDISAMGASVAMTSPNNTYTISSGTSFSAPAIAGIAAQLYQAYRDFNGGANPDAALIKASILNSAEDIGNRGPDYKHGFGNAHAGRAYELLSNQQYESGTALQNGTHTHTFTVPSGVKEARFMVYWNERPASPLSSKVLINDLDLSIQNAGGTQFLPAVLDPSPNSTTLNLPAVPGIDTLNNVEQVILINPAAGAYTINVQGTAVPDGAQSYYVLYSYIYDQLSLTYPLGGESLVPGQTERIRWDAYGNSGTFTLEFLPDSGANWTTLSSTLSASSRFYDWTIPATITAEARLRISRNGLSDQGEAAFHIIGQPTGLNILQVCPNELTFDWQAVTSAIAYDIFLLGDTYMDSIDQIPAAQLSYSYPITDLNQAYWFSVRAIGANGVIGRRAFAIGHLGGRFNCVIDNDVIVEDVFPASTGPFQDCRANSSFIQVQLNNGSNAGLTNVPLAYQYDNGPVVYDTMTSFLAPNNPFIFTFPQLQDLGGLGTHTLKVWSSFPMDSMLFNDTIEISLVIEDGDVQIPGFIEDFESFALCSTQDNCGGTLCPLNGGWTNIENGTEDQIDWRPHKGATPSNQTGPIADHRPGNATGTYLYLETSGVCNLRSASLVSPCIDLSETDSPELSFWYHMFGSGIGQLELDVFVGGIWIEDIMPTITADQGDQWNERIVDLSAYAGQVINLRFRGRTGFGPMGDIAIDDISVYDQNGPPTIDFVADRRETCVGGIINFTETAVNDPTGFVWKFSPNAVAYQNGTSSTSANPSVSFSSGGNYTVQLFATNAFGSDSLIRTSYIEVSDGPGLDVIEDFEGGGGGLPSLYWSAVNPDNEVGWESRLVIGSAGNPTRTAALLNFDQDTLSVIAIEDYLESDAINLSGADQPWLIFDVSFAQRNDSTFDELRVEISIDCGEIFVPIYSKSGSQLATVPIFEDNWEPFRAMDWRQDSVNLSPFAGESVIIRMVGINQLGFSNNLILDNIQVKELGNGAPVANFSSDVSIVCVGEPILFTDQSTGDSIAYYDWSFGADASLSTASDAGPHSVSYSSSGIKFIQLSVANGSDTTSTIQVVQVEELPQAAYSVDILGSTFTFSNSSQHATSYLWDFGDGNTSTEVNPVHTYQDADESYTVNLIALGPCGSDSLTQTLVSLEQSISGAKIHLFPNPNQGQFVLEIDDPLYREWEASLMDLQGRVLQQITFEQITATRWGAEIQGDKLAEGIYLIQCKTDQLVVYQKVMIFR